MDSKRAFVTWGRQCLAGWPGSCDYQVPVSPDDYGLASIRTEVRKCRFRRIGASRLRETAVFHVWILAICHFVRMCCSYWQSCTRHSQCVARRTPFAWRRTFGVHQDGLLSQDRVSGTGDVPKTLAVQISEQYY